ncbi:tumor protein p63-regulated gene 1-like protein isoform X2 [Diabrotica virgifera virgifera]|uniref:HSac2 domain-containing protein n=1 Tax=Diabrotica virgifera virgifera TaxID=50390 RepID=A0ABM5K1V1_DIAVI|nr:tumor protein p63-regulated gene 1-like protein isoform X2 [Diabrotica virgifera virgifera]
MIEMALEEDLPEEFKGGTLRIHPDRSDPPKSPNPAVNKIDNASEINNQGNNYNWRGTFMAPLSSIPNKISETIWSSKGSKDETPPPTATATTAPVPTNEKSCCQSSIIIKEDPNNFFTFRDGVIERAVKECTAHLLDETEGPVYASFLLTQINHWDTDKERLLLLTAKNLILVKYDFIALRRLGCRKVMYSDIEGIVVGNLVYPNGSLIPDRNMRGIRLLLKQDKTDNFASKWNPFNTEVPFMTFTYHPLYFHKDCTDERLRSVYDLDLFIENICISVQKWKENAVILQHNILLENYVGLASVIHNRNSLGFFKVRGKFSF